MTKKELMKLAMWLQGQAASLNAHASSGGNINIDRTMCVSLTVESVQNVAKNMSRHAERLSNLALEGFEYEPDDYDSLVTD